MYIGYCVACKKILVYVDDILIHWSQMRSIGCKWVYTINLKFDGSLSRFKAHVIAFGYCQEYDIDYDEVFAYFAKMTIVHVLLVLVTAKSWPIFHIDMPLDYVVLSTAYICGLCRSQYGLKQAPCA